MYQLSLYYHEYLPVVQVSFAFSLSFPMDSNLHDQVYLPVR